MSSHLRLFLYTIARPREKMRDRERENNKSIRESKLEAKQVASTSAGYHFVCLYFVGVK